MHVRKNRRNEFFRKYGEQNIVKIGLAFTILIKIKVDHTKEEFFGQDLLHLLQCKISLEYVYFSKISEISLI